MADTKKTKKKENIHFQKVGGVKKPIGNPYEKKSSKK